MRVLVFADSGWSVGRVHHDVALHIPDWEWTFLNWRNFDWNVFADAFETCDVCLTNIVSIRFWQSCGFQGDFRKCLFMSHGYVDNEATPVEAMNPYWVYGTTSEFIRPLFPDVRVFVMPNGVEPSHFTYRPRDDVLRNVGWCGADVPFKRREWALRIANTLNVPLSVASNLSFEDTIKWYDTIDVLVVTAWSETGPLPAFEAIVSGVPVIGTPVGNFAYVPGPKGTTADEIADILRNNDLASIAREQYDYVMKNWTYATLAPTWRGALEFTRSRYLEHNGIPVRNDVSPTETTKNPASGEPPV
jgi:glycosyltransferase involved in cell wall biosynthesis